MGILKKIAIILLLAAPLAAQEYVCGIAVFDNEAVPEWKIKGLLRTKEIPWYKRILGDIPIFSSRRLKEDLSIVENFYRSQGYLVV